MRLSLIFVLILTISLSCGAVKREIAENIEQQQPVTITSDIFTLEKTFYGEGTGNENEFNLEKNPWALRYLDVNKAGDMFLEENQKIKIFDRNGMLKGAIVNPESEDGKFEGDPRENYSMCIFVGPEGYITVLTKDREYYQDYYYYLYAPDYSFIERKKLTDNPKIGDLTGAARKLYDYLPDSRITKMIALNGAEKIYDTIVKKKDALYISLYYENGETRETLLQVEMPVDSYGVPQWYYLNELGGLMWEPVSGRKILYINTNEEQYDVQAGAYYSIHLLSLDSREDKVIARRGFSPMNFSAGQTGKTVGYWLFSTNRRKIKDYREKQFSAFTRHLMVDGNVAFIRSVYGNEMLDHIIDVFDIESKQFTGSFRFSENLRYVEVIKNESAYKIIERRNAYTVLERYRIDPAVYGK